MHSARSQVGWGFWLRWVLASSVGLTLGFTVIVGLYEAFGEVVDKPPIAVTGAVIGISIGIAQWLVLRSKLVRSGWWILASAGGFAVAFGAIGSVEEVVAITFAVGVASVGIAQWLVIRTEVPRSGWWVLASAVSIAAGFAIIFALPEAVGEAVSYGIAETIAAGIGGAVVGAISGAVLVWLLRQAAEEEDIRSRAAT